MTRMEVIRAYFTSTSSNVTKRFESLNTMASLLWWIVGFYFLAATYFCKGPHVCTGQEGASEADLSILPKYRVQIVKNENRPCIGEGKMIPVEMTTGYLANERILLPEDAECCVCLSPYEDGVELHALPCNHHFHSNCIVKWLKINATCPLCKYNILKGSEQV